MLKGFERLYYHFGVAACSEKQMGIGDADFVSPLCDSIKIRREPAKCLTKVVLLSILDSSTKAAYCT